MLHASLRGETLGSRIEYHAGKGSDYIKCCPTFHCDLFGSMIFGPFSVRNQHQHKNNEIIIWIKNKVCLGLFSIETKVKRAEKRNRLGRIHKQAEQQAEERPTDLRTD